MTTIKDLLSNMISKIHTKMDTPTVTEDDNGKILTVVDGKFALSEGIIEDNIIGLSFNPQTSQYSSSRTYSDMLSLFTKCHMLKAVYVYTPAYYPEAHVSYYQCIAIKRIFNMSTASTCFRFSFFDDDGNLFELQLNNDDSVEKLS